MEHDTCIPVDDLAAYASSELPAPRLQRVESHLSACEDCRTALRAVWPTQHATGSPPIAAPFDADEASVPPGTVIGRFVIGRRIGAGGMGVVYVARDPELNRDVAIKVLRGRGGTGAMLEARMRREAQAMARLSHPNVLPIFDVGMYDGRLSVAMELVDGGTLREWLAREKRSVAQIVDAFVKAGMGLAAAHAAGLVHRDFKPDNVLVGKDGQVRVTDFGLARFAGAPSESDPGGGVPAPAGAPSGTDAITRTGAVLGTPAYMSPEQLRGEPADARTDQFSFCVALYEALAGVRPIPGAGSAPDAPSGRIPRWLRRPLLRGLSLLPSGRYPDMTLLLAALRAGPPKLGRRLGVGALVVAGVVAASVARERRARGIDCELTGARARSAWSPADRDAVEKAFTSTGQPSAGDTFRRTSTALDAYAAQWSTTAVASCKSKPSDVPNGELSMKRATCFDARLGALQAFVGVLRRADAKTLERAVEGARALPSIETCAGKDPLKGEPLPSDPAVRESVGAVEQALRQAAALRTAGRFTEALEASTKDLADAERIAFPPLRARALFALAEAQEDAGDVAGAEATYRRASLAAEQAGSWEVAARALIGEAWRAADRGDFDRAEERFDHAAVWVERAGDEDALRGELLLSHGRELEERGTYEEAGALEAQALARFERAGDEHGATQAMNELGIVADYRGRGEEARGFYRRVIERNEKVYGPSSVQVATALGNLGMSEGDEGDYDAAIRDVSRALAINQKVRGPDHPSTAESEASLAGLLVAAKRPDEALPLALHAVTIAESAFGPDSLDVAIALASVSTSEIRLSRYDEAVAAAERALAICVRTGTPLVLADARADLGIALVASGRDKVRGRALLVQARDTFLEAGRTGRVPDLDERIGEAKR